MGFFVGTGDQDNYVQLVVSANGGAGGIAFSREVGGAAVSGPTATVPMPGPARVDLFLTVDPAAATVQAAYAVLVDGVPGPIVDLGGPEPIPPDWLSGPYGLAVGIIATSEGPGAPFPATWDFIAAAPGAAGEDCVRPADCDEDGVPTATDCDDRDFTAYPGAPEVCDGRDNDCDTAVDEGIGGDPCATGQLGPCAAGTRQCQGGALVCLPNAAPAPELCNLVDDDCDGVTDDGDPGGGLPCATGLAGACAAGTSVCQDGALQCVADAASAQELCATDVDEDCDGAVDEVADCVLCAAADTVAATAQTRRTTVKLRDDTVRDKVLTSGTFAPPDGAGIAPDQEPVTIRVTDAAALYWEATIPAGSFQRAANGRTFTFSDRSLANGGVRLAKLVVSSDRKRVKYRVKAEPIHQPDFHGSTSTVTVRVGGRCFVDVVDMCTPTARGVGCE
jgi:hypothetical protein